MSQTDPDTSNDPFPEIGDVDSVLSLIDDITAGDDLASLAAISVLRDRLHGHAPSIIIRKLVIVGDPNDEINRLQKLNSDLEARLAAATSSSGVVKPENGFYSLAQFHAKLQQKMGRTYAWRVDYIESTKTTPDCRLVKNEEIQRWQQTRQVPDWAYDQIENLIFNPRKGENGPTWADWETDFVIDLYQGTAVDSKGEKIISNSATSNLVFAKHCTERFGRDITENAIKGAIDRLRKKGKLPKRRNAKPA